MAVTHRYRSEITALLFVGGFVTYLLYGFATGTIPPEATISMPIVIGVLIAGLLSGFDLSINVFLPLSIAIALGEPLIFERSIQFELYGVAIAMAIVGGLFLYMAVSTSVAPASRFDRDSR